MRYILRKVVLFIITLWAAITLNFLLPRLMPGSPVDAALGKLASAGVPITNAERNAVEAQLGVPHTSLFVQYGDYLKDIFTLNFGASYTFPSQTVAQTIGKALPWTLMLVGVTTIVAFIIGTLLGVYAGWHRGRASDTSITVGATFFGAFPPFWLGLLLLYLSGLQVRLVPDQGGLQPGDVRPTGACPSWVTRCSTACCPR